MNDARSPAKITDDHLERLARIAAADRRDRFNRQPRWRPYSERILCTALCQGAALHFVDDHNGVKDFDVFTFYAEDDVGPFPPRWRTTADFGPSVFGRYPSDPQKFTGRRIDLFGRSLPVSPSANAIEVVRNYLRAGRTSTSKLLAAKAVVAVAPSELCGVVIWPEGSRANAE